jgi:hypothetical protein
MTDVLSEVRRYLIKAEYEIGEAPKPFAFVAQNASVLVFVAPVEPDIQTTRGNVLGLLSGPFRSKRFGPKTMEMYCVFVSENPISLPEVERCEQDMKVCRKVVVTSAGVIDARLSFLCPLDDTMTAPLDASGLYWAELRKRLSDAEIQFLRQVEGGSASTQSALALARKLP